MHLYLLLQYLAIIVRSQPSQHRIGNSAPRLSRSLSARDIAGLLHRTRSQQTNDPAALVHILLSLLDAANCSGAAHMMQHFFFFLLSWGIASKSTWSRFAIMEKLGRLSGCRSQHSSTSVIISWGTGFPNLTVIQAPAVSSNSSYFCEM